MSVLVSMFVCETSNREKEREGARAREKAREREFVSVGVSEGERDRERGRNIHTYTREPLVSKLDLQIERGTTRKSHDRHMPSRHQRRLSDATLPLPAEYALHVLC